MVGAEVKLSLIFDYSADAAICRTSDNPVNEHPLEELREVDVLNGGGIVHGAEFRQHGEAFVVVLPCA